jgi:hypothetical protein
MYIARILVIFVLLLFGASTFADVSPRISTFQDQAIEAIVRSSYGEANLLDNILMKKGFPPSKDSNISSRLAWISFVLNDAYETWPEIVKLETAYVMAEAAIPGSGDNLLRDIALDIERHNKAISLEPALQSYYTEMSFLLQPFNQPKKYACAILSVSETQNARQRLDSRVQRTIDIISKYAPAFPGGSVRAMDRCCKISEKKAFEILRESPSIREALALAILTGTLPPELQARVSRLVLFAIDNNIAIEQELMDEHKLELDIERNREREAMETNRKAYEAFGLGAALGLGTFKKPKATFDDLRQGFSPKDSWTVKPRTEPYRPRPRPVR